MFVGVDPSTKTGFVALDENGAVIKAKELTGIGDKDPKRLVTLIFEISSHIKKSDIICIEGFPYATQRAMFAGGLHHGIRNELFKRHISYYDVAPNSVKKFVNVTGWVGKAGSKKRLTGRQKKLAIMKAVKDHFGFSHNSDNVVDAYILAQIARSIHQYGGISNIHSYQAEVIDKVLEKGGNANVESSVKRTIQKNAERR